MRTVDLILRKRGGDELSVEEIQYLINGYTTGDIPDYQMAAFLMATYFSGMTDRELSSFTEVMMASGESLNLDDIPGVKVDKHSTGGVGDKTSLICAPIAAAAGVDRTDDFRAQPGTHRRHARQARIDSGLPHRSDDRSVPRATRTAWTRVHGAIGRDRAR